MRTTNITVLSGEMGTTINLGRQGEYGVREVEFDLSNLISEIGEGTAVLVHNPFKGSAYLVPSAIGETYDGAVQSDDTLTWSVGQLATLYHGGGQAELRWYVDGALKKSCIYKTSVTKSLGETSEITDVQQSYIDQMAQLASYFTSMDSTPTQGSDNAVTSDGIWDALQNIVVSGAVTSVNGQTGDVVINIPSLVGYATETWVQSQGYLTQHQDLSLYALKSWVEGKGYLTSAPVTSVNGSTGDVTINIPSLVGYATESWVENKGYITSAPVTSVNNQTGAVVLSIPTKTSDLQNDSGFLTSAPVSSVNGQTGVVVIANATTSVAGLMSATDKSNLDAVHSDYQSAINALG